MAADKEARWIKRFGEHKTVKAWLVANPPPENWEGKPEAWAYQEMTEDPIDEPLVPDDDDELHAPVTRKEHDELREQVRNATRGFNRAIKKRREVPPPPPAPPPAPPVARKPGGLAAILAPLKRR